MLAAGAVRRLDCDTKWHALMCVTAPVITKRPSSSFDTDTTRSLARSRHIRSRCPEQAPRLGAIQLAVAHPLPHALYILNGITWYFLKGILQFPSLQPRSSLKPARPVDRSSPRAGAASLTVCCPLNRPLRRLARANAKMRPKVRLSPHDAGGGCAMSSHTAALSALTRLILVFLHHQMYFMTLTAAAALYRAQRRRGDAGRLTSSPLLLAPPAVPLAVEEEAHAPLEAQEEEDAPA